MLSPAGLVCAAVVAAVVHAAQAKPKDSSSVRVSAHTESDRSEAWGFVELNHAGKEYEFVKATFGGPLHCQYEPMKLAEPLDLCSTPDTEASNGAILVAERGNCSFADKAYFAQVAGAHGVVMVNSDQSMPRLPGAYMVVPEEDPVIHIPMVAVRRTAGIALRNIIAREGGVVQAAIVAKHWTSQGTFLTGPCTKVYNTQNDIANKTHYKGVEVLSTDGGRLVLEGGEHNFEYLRADFGGPIPEGQLQLAIAEPADGCQPLTNADEVRGKVVIVWRGGCAFTQKAHELEVAGARAAVVVNSNDVLLTMAEGEILEDYVTIYTVIISQTAGEQLKQLLQEKQGMQVSMEATDVLAAHWDSLEGIMEDEDWPEDAEERRLKYEKLLTIHDPAKSGVGDKGRLEILQERYASAEGYWGAGEQEL